MPFIILSIKGEGIGQWELKRPITVGRSPECDVSVRDILLSRRHCRLEPMGGRWAVVDLGSKNGTRVGGKLVKRHVLRDGDVLRIGKVLGRYRVGKSAALLPGNRLRPATPIEALSGTVAGLGPNLAPGESRRGRFPSPRPMPREPAAYERDDLYSMLTEIASSSWDSIYATASRPLRTPPESPMQLVMTRPPGRVANRLSRLTLVRPVLDAISRERSKPKRPAHPADEAPARWRGLFASVVSCITGAIRQCVAPRGSVRMV